MAKLTKRKALDNMRQMCVQAINGWDKYFKWYQVEGFSKQRVFNDLFLKQESGSQCFACTYRDDHPVDGDVDYYCMKKCIIDWGTKEGWCMEDGSPYIALKYDPEIKHVKAILALIDQAIDKLPKPKKKRAKK